MRIDKFFKGWSKVIDLKCTEQTVKKLVPETDSLCPSMRDVFKAFQCCDYDSLRVVIIGKEPYNQRFLDVPIATGIAFANSKETPKHKYSQYLASLRESVIDYSTPTGIVNFDPSLEKWEKQGVLLLNMALTTSTDKEACHIQLWQPFMTSLLKNLSLRKAGIIYVLLGSEVYLSLKDFINSHSNTIIPVFNPSSYLPPSLWKTINKILIAQNGYGIEWYEEDREQEN